MFKRQHYIVFSLVLFVVLVVLNLPDQKTIQLKLAIGGLFLPLFGMASSAQNLADQAGNSLASRGALLNEVDRLRRENQELQALLVQAQEALRENAQLHQALAWQKRALWELKPARVVGHDPANWWRTILIDVGTRDRVSANMTVLTAEGLVGRISKVGFDRSQVLMVGDPNCRFSVQVQQSTDKSVVAKGIIAPSASSLDRLLVDLIWVPGGSLMKPGQSVVTSGDGVIFPKGLPVGNIVDVRTNDFGLNLEARVKLAVNLNHLEQVWVMMQ